ncbi:MAG: NAD(P)H-dependent oxidoreductase [Bacteroidales bacterium]|nr:NAD(P)H-dependent oxidoreductase [Bacteroidales bacterium]MCF8328651.1 NAD(P)H-dependent oxidoreductase [Bacteroidales bacterium]
MTTKIALIYGSVRKDRQGIRAARYLKRKLQERSIHVDLIDPLEYQLPMLDKMYKEFEPGKAPESMKKLSEIFDQSDGFLIVSGEYNHSIPPALKNILDHFQSEYMFKPSAIASYSAGIFGGMRVAMHLRAVLGELGMPAISSLLPIPQISSALDEKGTPQNKYIEPSTNRFLDEFEWYIEALKSQRAMGTPF